MTGYKAPVGWTNLLISIKSMHSNGKHTTHYSGRHGGGGGGIEEGGCCIE